MHAVNKKICICDLVFGITNSLTFSSTFFFLVRNSFNFVVTVHYCYYYFKSIKFSFPSKYCTLQISVFHSFLLKEMPQAESMNTITSAFLCTDLRVKQRTNFPLL